MKTRQAGRRVETKSKSWVVEEKMHNSEGEKLLGGKVTSIIGNRCYKKLSCLPWLQIGSMMKTLVYAREEETGGGHFLLH